MTAPFDVPYDMPWTHVALERCNEQDRPDVFLVHVHGYGLCMMWYKFIPPGCPVGIPTEPDQFITEGWRRIPQLGRN